MPQVKKLHAHRRFTYTLAKYWQLGSVIIDDIPLIFKEFNVNCTVDMLRNLNDGFDWSPMPLPKVDQYQVFAWLLFMAGWPSADADVARVKAASYDNRLGMINDLLHRLEHEQYIVTKDVPKRKLITQSDIEWEEKLAEIKKNKLISKN